MSQFTNLYNNGQWGYMGIGPMPAYPISMTITTPGEYPDPDSYFTCGAGDNWSILAYLPTDQTKYAVMKNTTLGTIYVTNPYSPSYRIVSNDPMNYPDIPASVTVDIPTDPDAWNFYGGLTSLEGCALCMWVPNTTGSAPNGCDYVSIGESQKSWFSYEDDREEFAYTIDGNYIYAKRAERDANGNVISSLPASTSADEDKVLTVDSNGDAVWATPQGGGGSASYTPGDGIRIDANDEISVKVSDDFSVGEYITTNINNNYISVGFLYLPTKLKTIAKTFSCTEIPSEVKAVLVLYYGSSHYAVYDTDTVIGSYSDGSITYTNNVVLNVPTDNSAWTWTGTSVDVSAKLPSNWSLYVCAKDSTGSIAGLQPLPLKASSDYAFNRNVPYITIKNPLPYPSVTQGRVLTIDSSATNGYKWADLPTWSSDYGVSVDNSTHKINVTAITPADKQINVLGKTNVPDMKINLVNPNTVPNFTTIPADYLGQGDWGYIWRSKALTSYQYPGLDNGSAVTLYLNIPNDVVLTGSYSGATLSSSYGIWAYDNSMRNEINITSSIIDSNNIFKIPAGRYAVTMNMSQVYGSSSGYLCLSVDSWLESGGNQVALSSSDNTLISTAMADWTFDWPLATGTHYEMDITAIPAFSSLDAGKVLQVQNDGTLAWVTLS